LRLAPHSSSMRFNARFSSRSFLIGFSYISNLRYFQYPRSRHIPYVSRQIESASHAELSPSARRFCICYHIGQKRRGCSLRCSHYVNTPSTCVAYSILLSHKVLTLQTLPAVDEPFSTQTGNVAGFYLHAGVADLRSAPRRAPTRNRYPAPPP